MANPVGFQGANFIFGAPAGREDTVRDLEVAIFPDHSVSCWRLSEEELAEVQRTGVVWLRIEGTRMFPVYVSGEALVLIGDEPAKAEPYIPLKGRS
jgi:hypothetical protein